MENIRKATTKDLSRIGEILTFNNRINFFPIFKDEEFSFGTVNVLYYVKEHLEDDMKLLKQTYVYDDGIVRGLIRIDGKEVSKLFVEPAFQSMGVGAKLLEYAVKEHGVEFLWALEKTTVELNSTAVTDLFQMEKKSLKRAPMSTSSNL